MAAERFVARQPICRGLSRTRARGTLGLLSFSKTFLGVPNGREAEGILDAVNQARSDNLRQGLAALTWIPAFAGMTTIGGLSHLVTPAKAGVQEAKRRITAHPEKVR